MNSRDSFSMESLDILIAEVLRAEVRGADPSPRVWMRIRHQARAWFSRQSHHLFTVVARRPRSYVFVPLIPQTSYVDAHSCFYPWRYDAAVLRFLGHMGAAYRLGW